MSEASDYWKANDEYHERNSGRVETNRAFFEKALSIPLADDRATPIESAIEFGAGVGDNLSAIDKLFPGIELWGVEINEAAAQEIPVGKVIRGSFLNTKITPVCDLTLTKGVLIHIPPENLPRAYKCLYRQSKKYILIAEYYAPNPSMIPYRGKDNLLWKRDFCGELMDAFPDLKLVDYGFSYHRDPNPQDDLHYFLLEKP